MVHAIAFPNFRDFGGQNSRYGGRVATDRLYRSSRLAGADDKTMLELIKLDFQLIADMRYKSEQDSEPSRWPANYASRIFCHGSDRETEAPHLTILRSKATDPAVVTHYFTEFYSALPFDELYALLFAKIIDQMAEVSGRVLIHCTAGKDRTGFIVALVQHIFGVAPDSIMADFMLSAAAKGFSDQAPILLAHMRADYGYEVPLAIVQQLLSVKEVYLIAAMESIKARFGTVDHYLDSIGVTESRRQKLRDQYLTG